MSEIVKSSLTALIAGERPTPAAIQDCFTAIMDGDVGEAQMAAFLIAPKIRGEQVDDIAAAATVMRAKALTIPASDLAMDIVGTGGDGFGTYNISTASAFVVAGCGIPVAKHGNKAVSSKSHRQRRTCPKESPPTRRAPTGQRHSQRLQQWADRYTWRRIALTLVSGKGVERLGVKSALKTPVWPYHHLKFGLISL